MLQGEGYFTELDYGHYYHYHISPINIEMNLLLSGYLWSSDKFHRYLELGFGQGISFNAHAATFDAEFYGVDFNSDYAVFASQAAAVSGANVKIYNQSFKEFAERDDLPDFDIIVMHGVWSWISQENKQILVDFVRRKLTMGGVFYVSYNTPLGKWTRALPLRNLMKLYYERMVTESDSPEVKIKRSIDFMESVAKANPAFLENNPQLAQEINFIKNIAQPSYIAGEYFGDHWDLTSFSKMAGSLSEAKLTFAGGAIIRNKLDLLNLNEATKQKIDEIKDPILKEQARDLLLNNEFRCDLWVKGVQSITPDEKNERMGNLRFALARTPEECKLTIDTRADKIELPEKLYVPLLKCLHDMNYKPKKLKELMAYDVLREFNEQQIMDALILLTGLAYVFVAHGDDLIEKAKVKTNPLNQFILEQAVHNDSIPYLISPVIGCAVLLTRVQKLFLLARSEGEASTDEWAALTWQLLSRQDEIVKLDDDIMISSADEGMSYLKAMAENFANRVLPLLQALGIVS